jgi:hypothetical protein
MDVDQMATALLVGGVFALGVLAGWLLRGLKR